MNEERTEAGKHLTDAELFALAAPATGEPEALPGHLSLCRDCARALREWKTAMTAVGDADAGALDRRSAEEWRAREEETLAAIRKQGRRRPVHAWRWALAAAASLLVAVLVLSGRRSAPVATAARGASTPRVAASAAASTDLSPADAADDALLREASFLASGGDVDTEGLAGRL